MTQLVLLPGMDGTGLLLKPLLAASGGDIQSLVIAYPTDEILDYQKLETFVRAQLPEKEPFVLLGESFSGPIAISIASSPPQNLIALILCCSFAKNPRPMLAWFKWLTTILPGLKSATLASPMLLGRHATPVSQQQLSTALSKVSAAVLRARLRAVCDIDVTDALERIRRPILYLRATSDQLVPKNAARIIQALAPQTRIEEVDGPHMLLQAAPQISAGIISRFVSEISNQ